MAAARDEAQEIAEAGTIEWVRLPDGRLVACAATRLWVHRDGALPEPPAVADPICARRMLDAMVGAGQRVHLGRGPAGAPFTLAGWAAFLAASYHTSHATPRVMAEVAARFEALGEPALAAWALGKVTDEAGQDTLALKDLRALGHDAEAFVESVRPAKALAVIARFEAYAREPRPLGSVGYAYALERLAMARSARYVRRIESLLPEGVLATRCLRVYSGASGAADHVGDIVPLVAGLAPPDRRCVYAAVFETAALCTAPATDEPAAEARLAATPPQPRGTHDRA